VVLEEMDELMAAIMSHQMSAEELQISLFHPEARGLYTRDNLHAPF
jgi:hypothetical protein